MTNQSLHFNSLTLAKGWMITNATQSLSCCSQTPVNSFIWHDGGITGVASFLGIFPDQDAVVVVLQNKGAEAANEYNELGEMVRNIIANFL